MDFQNLAQKIISNIGGKENVVALTHCSTRLRFQLADDTKPSKEKLEKLSGILGVTNKGGQYQLIIGGDVPEVYAEVNKLIGAQGTHLKKVKKSIGSNILDVITGSITPIIPLICGPGLLAAFLALFANFGWIDTAGNTYYILNTIAASGLFFIPVFLGFSISKKIGTDPFFGALIGAILLHPNMIELATKGTIDFTLFMIPMKVVNYSSSMVPIFFAIFFLKYVDIFLDKIIPKVMRIFLKPFLILLIVMPVTLWVFGPIGIIIGDWIASVMISINSWAAWLAVGIVGAIMPWLTLTGMHLSLLPIGFAGFATMGYDALLFPAALAHNIACAGAGFGVALKSKNKELRALAINNSITAILGITEPILFTVHLKLRRPLWAVTIGSSFAGIFMGLMGVRAITPAAGLLTIGGFIGSTFVWACVGAGLSFVIAFIAQVMIGFDEHLFDDVDVDVQNIEYEKESNPMKKQIIHAPIKGKLIPLKELSDDAFMKMGIGIGIVPESNEIVSPGAGVIKFVFDTQHALGIVCDNGVELLIHIGIDTVNLKGEGFHMQVKEGQHVKLGDVLMQVAFNEIMEKGFDPITIIVVTNSNEYLDVFESTKDKIDVGEEIITVLC